METLNYKNKEYLEYHIADEVIFIPKSLFEKMQYYGDMKNGIVELTFFLNENTQIHEQDEQ